MDNEELIDGGIYCITTLTGNRWIYKYKRHDGVFREYLASHEGALCVVFSNKVDMKFFHAVPLGSFVIANEYISEIRKATENEIAMFNFYKSNYYVD